MDPFGKNRSPFLLLCFSFWCLNWQSLEVLSFTIFVTSKGAFIIPNQELCIYHLNKKTKGGNLAFCVATLPRGNDFPTSPPCGPRFFLVLERSEEVLLNGWWMSLIFLPWAPSFGPLIVRRERVWSETADEVSGSRMSFSLDLVIFFKQYLKQRFLWKKYSFKK